ncbi:MAG: S-methyl-5-thioribose-1-phosphate isomerase, partial [Coriobacteriia bacterium]|nr:S-methyl-5-thioribose-1-phosphate isomerase [Coriobacteriia bacterium]
YSSHSQGKVEHVWVDETRPVNQGGRLTAWELLHAGVPSQLICDNMAAFVMGEGLVDVVVVGADRVTANGDAANKIGTYGLAILAKEHGIPFYIAAPSTTFDLTLEKGKQIEIEVRDEEEISGVTVSGTFDATTPEVNVAFEKMTIDGPAELPMSKGHHMTIMRKGGGFAFDAWLKNTPTHVSCFNPAFDVTPAKYITGYITERGVLTADEIRTVMAS